MMLSSRLLTATTPRAYLAPVTRCETCEGMGQKTDKHGAIVLCPDCEGTGKREKQDLKRVSWGDVKGQFGRDG